MNKLYTIDKVEILWCYSRFDPSGPQDGMAPAMSCIWIKAPGNPWYKVDRHRSSMKLRETIENLNIYELLPMLYHYQI